MMSTWWARIIRYLHYLQGCYSINTGIQNQMLQLNRAWTSTLIISSSTENTSAWYSQTAGWTVLATQLVMSEPSTLHSYGFTSHNQILLHTNWVCRSVWGVFFSVPLIDYCEIDWMIAIASSPTGLSTQLESWQSCKVLGSCVVYRTVATKLMQLAIFYVTFFLDWKLLFFVCPKVRYRRPPWNF